MNALRILAPPHLRRRQQHVRPSPRTPQPRTWPINKADIAAPGAGGRASAGPGGASNLT